MYGHFYLIKKASQQEDQYGTPNRSKSENKRVVFYFRILPQGTQRTQRRRGGEVIQIQGIFYHEDHEDHEEYKYRRFLHRITRINTN